MRETTPNRPKIIFADSTEAIFLADMSGDGLSDIVRMDMMNRLQAEIRQKNFFALADLRKDVRIEMSLGIERRPAGTDDEPAEPLKPCLRLNG